LQKGAVLDQGTVLNQGTGLKTTAIDKKKSSQSKYDYVPVLTKIANPDPFWIRISESLDTDPDPHEYVSDFSPDPPERPPSFLPTV